MHLIPDWRRVLARAWSIRLMILAAILSGIEVVLPFVEPYGPRGIFAAASGIVTGAAFMARLIAQRNMENGDAD